MTKPKKQPSDLWQVHIAGGLDECV